MESIVSSPDVYIRLRKLMENQSSTIADFAALASSDIQLSAAILEVVNSEFFGLTGKIDDITSAVNLLGIGQVYEMVLGIFELSHPQQAGSYCPVQAVNRAVSGYRLS